MKKNAYLVFGCGRFGESVALKLMKLGMEVMVIDKNASLIQAISDKVTHAIVADATDDIAMASLKLERFATAVICIGNDLQASVLISINMKELGIARVVTKAHSLLHAQILYKVGCDRVVFPEREMGIRLAKGLVIPNIQESAELAPDYSIAEIAPLMHWYGKKLGDLKLKENHHVNLMAIKRGPEFKTNLSDTDKLYVQDRLVIFGHNKDLIALAVLDDKELDQ